MNFQENVSNGRPDTAEKAFRSSSKEHFLLDRLQPSLTSLWSMHGECKFWSFSKSPRMEFEIQPKGYFVLQVNCPWLLTDHNQTDILCRAFVEITKSGASGKSFKRSRCTAVKGLCKASKEAFVIDPFEPNLHRSMVVPGECDVWGFRKIPRMESEIQPRRYFVSQVKCCLLLTYFKQT
jgi:hypothetical protein